MVRTTVSVVTVVAMSTAWAATSSATSVAALAATLAVSARALAVRSGVKSQADAAVSDGKDVVDLFVVLRCGDCCGIDVSSSVCDLCDGENASMQRGGIAIAHSTAILAILVVLIVLDDGDVIQHAFANGDGVLRALFSLLKALCSTIICCIVGCGGNSMQSILLAF